MKCDPRNIIYHETNGDGIKKRRITIPRENDHFGKLLDVESNEYIPCKTFMIFSVEKIPVDECLAVHKPKVRTAFRHNLTKSGIESRDFLKSSLLERYSAWKTPSSTVVAPIVSLCQSSGVGKSKLSIELLKENPGFYVVFRDEEQSGYPQKNSITDNLKNLISQYQDSDDIQLNIEYNQCTVGRILAFVARVIASCFVSINVRALTGENDSDSKIDYENLLMNAIHSFGKQFELNEDIKMIGVDEFSEILETNFKKDFYSVETIADFIENLLIDPKLAFINPNEQTKLFCQLLKNHLDTFPFFFVLDEAEILTQMSLKQISSYKSDLKISGLEVFRRAISYLNHNHKILFLTLGTKSTISSLNPPVVDVSFRYPKRNKILNPIILTSNMNIFSKEYPMHEIEPTYDYLTNPISFKFLATLGRGLLGCYSFSDISSIFMTKILNGSSNTTMKYILALWMIRTGAMANRFHPDSTLLVSNHMASLLQASSNLSELIVNYPSEPIMALAAKNIMKSMSKNESEILFTVFKNQCEALAIDRGEFAETFASMTLLLIADNLENRAQSITLENYDHMVKKIKEITPEKFHSLWDKKEFLLEDEADIDKKSEENVFKICKSFPEHSVYYVSDFLNHFTENSIDLSKLGLSDDMLNGIINFTHIVPLHRDSDGSIANQLGLDATKTPLADPRIPDTSRNIIELADIKNGLIERCAYKLPKNYYGFDYYIPVCMKNNVYTFIGVQVKSSQAEISENVCKMQARLHYVCCPNCPKFSKKKPCKQCTPPEHLAQIYANQVTLLMSLDEEGSYGKFISGKTIFKNCSDESGKILMKSLENKNLTSLKLKEGESSESFFSPLVHAKIPLNASKLLSMSLWCDEYVSIKALKKDGYIHRQYCFVSRGLSLLKDKVCKGDASIKIADEILKYDPGIVNLMHPNPSKLELKKIVTEELGSSYVEFSARKKQRRELNDAGTENKSQEKEKSVMVKAKMATDPVVKIIPKKRKIFFKK